MTAATSARSRCGRPSWRPPPTPDQSRAHRAGQSGRAREDRPATDLARYREGRLMSADAIFNVTRRSPRACRAHSPRQASRHGVRRAPRRSGRGGARVILFLYRIDSERDAGAIASTACVERGAAAAGLSTPIVAARPVLPHHRGHGPGTSEDRCCAHSGSPSGSCRRSEPDRRRGHNETVHLLARAAVHR